MTQPASVPALCPRCWSLSLVVEADGCVTCVLCGWTPAEDAPLPLVRGRDLARRGR